jgi:hypothetical protein
MVLGRGNGQRTKRQRKDSMTPEQIRAAKNRARLARLRGERVRAGDATREQSTQDILSSVSVAQSKRRRPKESIRRQQWRMREVEEDAETAAVKRAAVEMRHELDADNLRRIQEWAASRWITSVAAAAAEDLRSEDAYTSYDHGKFTK